MVFYGARETQTMKTRGHRWEECNEKTLIQREAEEAGRSKGQKPLNNIPEVAGDVYDSLTSFKILFSRGIERGVPVYHDHRLGESSVALDPPTLWLVV